MFGATEGFFTFEAQVAWDFVLLQQELLGIHGNFAEIGVYKGKSAFLGALHLRPGETAVLIDIGDINFVERGIRALGGTEVVSFKGKSSNFRGSALYRDGAPVRFFHVDGDHSGFSVINDLQIAVDMLGDRGVICIDDFCNIRYPQLLAATYHFLFSRPDYKMFLCGSNKAYLCRAEDYPLYEGLVRHHLSDHLKRFDVIVTVAKTSYAHDFGCFAVEPRMGDYDYAGLDEDRSKIVF